MYTRSYNEDGSLSLPEGYGGTMLEPERNEREMKDERTVEASAPPIGGFLSGLSGGLSSLLRPFAPNEFKIGTEEILIGAVALFLLFSKNGDKECAIMLLLTLFITK